MENTRETVGKVYYEMYMGGKIRYTVNFHDGEKVHGDGSPFYDVRIFKNKVKKAEFVSQLVANGYNKEGEL